MENDNNGLGYHVTPLSGWKENPPRKRERREGGKSVMIMIMMMMMILLRLHMMI